MTWLKSLGSAVWVGILGFLAYMAVVRASKHKATAGKLRILAEDEKVVHHNLKKAEDAFLEAKTADGKAKQANKIARKHIDEIGKSRQEISTIMDRWKK